MKSVQDGVYTPRKWLARGAACSLVPHPWKCTTFLASTHAPQRTSYGTKRKLRSVPPARRCVMYGDCCLLVSASFHTWGRGAGMGEAEGMQCKSAVGQLSGTSRLAPRPRRAVFLDPLSPYCTPSNVPRPSVQLKREELPARRTCIRRP